MIQSDKAIETGLSIFKHHMAHKTLAACGHNFLPSWTWFIVKISIKSINEIHINI